MCVLFLVLSFLLLRFTTKIHALNSDPTRDKLSKALLISNTIDEKIKALGEGIITSSTDSIKAEDLDAPDVVIANYEEIVNDEKIISYLQNSITAGDVIYIRVDEIFVNREDIGELLGCGDSVGELTKLEDDKYAETIVGFFVYNNQLGEMQIVSSVNVLALSDTETNEGQVINDEVWFENINDSRSDVNVFEYDFSDELDDIDDYLDTVENYFVYETEPAQMKTRASTDVLHEKPYSTEHFYATVKNSNGEEVSCHIGNVTMNLYAKSPYCSEKEEEWRDKSAVTTKWIYCSKIFIQPKWNESTYYRSINKALGVYYVTHPIETSSTTHMMYLFDYAPSTPLDDSTNVTLSFGADFASTGTVSSGVSYSVSTNYKDVTLSNILWEREFDDDPNLCGFNFEFGNKTASFPIKTVNTSTIALQTGVVMWNYYVYYSKMQIGYTACWRILQGSSLLETNDFNVYRSKTVTWKPDVWW